MQITQTLHRVAVGATGRSPAIQTMRKRNPSPLGMPTIYVAGGHNAGELPLAPTLHVWTIIDDALQITQTLHRVAVGATGRSPATQTMRKHRISPQEAPTNIYVIAGRNAGELPLAPTLHVCAIFNNTLKITSTLRRVAVGATGRSPATHATQKRDLSPEGMPPHIRHRRAQRGRASTRPYIACMDSH